MELHHLSHIDLDGYSAQLLSSLVFPKQYYYNSNYGREINSRLCEIITNIRASEDSEAFVLITDLNTSLDDADFIDKECRKLREEGRDVKLQLLDHHITGESCALKFEWYYLDIKRSATKITYDFLSEMGFAEQLAPYEDYVRAVNQVDLWIEDGEYFEFGKVCSKIVSESRELNRYMFDWEHREYKFGLLKEAATYIGEANSHITLDSALHRLKKEYLNTTSEDNTLDNITAREVVRLLNLKKSELLIEYRGKRGVLTYALGSISNIANLFLKENSDVDFFMDVSPKGAVSMRSCDRADVSLIAKELFGGGGHKNASGGKMEEFKESFSYTKVKSFIQELLADRAE